MNTLKSRLTLLFGGLILVSTIISTALLSDLAVDAMQLSTGQNLQEVASQLRDKIDLDLYERYSDLKVAGAFATDRLASQRTPEIDSLLNALNDNFPSYAWIGLVTPDGTVLESTGGMLVGVNVSQRPWFQQAMEKPFLGDAHEALLLADMLGGETDTPLRFLDVAVPLRSTDGRLLAVLGAHLYLDWVTSMGESLAPINKRLGSEFLVADVHGVVLMGPPNSMGKSLPDALLAKVAGKESGYITASLPSSEAAALPQDYLVGFSRLKDRSEYASFDWLVLVRKPTAAAFQPARELQRSLVLVGALVGLVLIFFASVAARWTTSPIIKITEEASNLDPQNPDNSIQLREDYAEVKTLSSVLRDLIRNLANKTREMNELNTHLEARVTERTQALEQANQQLEMTARTDALTGLNNRRHYFELGEVAMKKAIRAANPLSVIMFDADHFKAVNDTYGHGAGDDALVHLGQLAQRVLRDTDILARVGGEEFAIVLENTTEEAAAEVAERLRLGIESTPLPLEHGPLGLTVSVGVACVTPTGTDDLDALLALADKALYAAKRAGRNRVVRYSVLPVTG